MKPIAELDDDELQAQARRALRELPDAPPAWQEAAIAAFSAPTPGGVGSAFAALAQGLVQHIAAVLTFDSWAAPSAAAGLRSAAPAAAATGATRHLLFSAQGRDIDLRIAPESGAFSIAGQVLGPDEAGAVALAEGGAGAGAPAAHTATLDALGEFRIDGIRRGAWVLTLQFGSDRIVLPPVEVGEPPR